MEVTVDQDISLDYRPEDNAQKQMLAQEKVERKQLQVKQDQQLREVSNDEKR